jgi:hypothetical protein
MLPSTCTAVTSRAMDVSVAWLRSLCLCSTGDTDTPSCWQRRRQRRRAASADHVRFHSLLVDALRVGAHEVDAPPADFVGLRVAARRRWWVGQRAGSPCDAACPLGRQSLFDVAGAPTVTVWLLLPKYSMGLVPLVANVPSLPRSSGICDARQGPHACC